MLLKGNSCTQITWKQQVCFQTREGGNGTFTALKQHPELSADTSLLLHPSAKKKLTQGMGFSHEKIHTLQSRYLKCLGCQKFGLTPHNAVADEGAEATEQNSVSIRRQSAEVGSHQTCSAHPLLTQPGSSSG